MANKTDFQAQKEMWDTITILEECLDEAKEKGTFKKLEKYIDRLKQQLTKP